MTTAKDFIEKDFDGIVVFSGTKVPVAAVMEWLATGHTIEETCKHLAVPSEVVIGFLRGVATDLEDDSPPHEEQGHVVLATLEELNGDPCRMASLSGRLVLIYSREHGRFWRQDGAGYSEAREWAGIYKFDDAWARTKHCGPEKGIEYVKAGVGS